jgi:acetylornithine deacetylase
MSADDAHQLLARLVAINSINPSLVPGSPGEGEAAQFVADWGTARGYSVEWIEPQLGRPSVVVTARGSGGGRSLVLNAHLDTVGVAGMSTPFVPRFEDGFLYGRGSCDMKAGLAASMAAMQLAAASALRGDVILTAVADEEFGSIGSEAVLKHVRADAAVLTEPTGMKLCLAHRGFGVFEVNVHGKASHTSQPERGLNAITLATPLLQACQRFDARLTRRKPHALLNHGTLHVTRIDGGSELFTTPEHCVLMIERRTLPGDDHSRALGEIQALIDGVRTSDQRFNAEVRTILFRDALETAADEAIAIALRDAVTDVTGVAPQTMGAPFWMDSGLFPAHGIPIVIYGVTGYGLHALDERVDLSELDQLTAVLTETIRAFCR